MSKSKLLSTVYQAAEGRRQCNMALRNKLAKNNEIDGISNILQILILLCGIVSIIKLFYVNIKLLKLSR